MFQCRFLIPLFFLISGLFAQETPLLYQIKKIKIAQDTIQIDSVSINESFFKILDAKQNSIDTIYYKVNFQKGNIVFRNNFKSEDSLTIRYLKFPKFLTKEYTIYDNRRVVSTENPLSNLQKVTRENKKRFTPFEGLTTSGSISRGISIGNSQNTSVNSNLDLQITGKLSEKVSLRASIQDSNIPLQEGGYSQRLDEFDQIFIELFGDKWAVRAGDLFLENRQSRFLNFNKKVQGLSTQFNFGNTDKKTQVYTSAALVRGQYAKSNFTGQEGNQGPYKLRGQNGELFILVVSGSERVFVNGILLKRGENNQYIIDYNAGEILFTSLFPITSEMRIVIEYQYSDRNYTRFVTYGGANHEQEKWSLGGYIYSENDVKNQPLQQNLSAEQIAVLSQAGDNLDAMNAPSAVLDVFSENKILYKKVINAGVEIFEYSTLETDVLYNVKFSFVGNNLGNYVISNTISNGRVFRYVPPISGVLQGNYNPFIRLVPPSKLQIATVLGKFNPNKKTAIDFEIGVSNNDKNLFSSTNDNNNKGVAGKFNFKQRLFSKKWTLDAVGNYQTIQRHFQTVERLFSIEFNRDWNLSVPTGNQNYITTGLQFTLPEKGMLMYQFENLDFSNNFSGKRHVVNGNFNLKNWNFSTNGSVLNSDGILANSKFIRNKTVSKYHFKKNWVGASFQHENNQEINKTNKSLSNLTQRFSEYGTFVGRGDSTKVFVEFGYLNRTNDSLQLGILKRVNTSNSYYMKSKLIQTDKNDLSVFVNYRNLKFEDPITGNEPSLNSRILYNDRFFKQLIQSTTAYETTSGTIPQQDFSFLEVEAGQGIFAWNDYNGNGIQEIQEFEVAPFPDQAKFVKVFLPNQIFIKTHQNKFSQSLTFNFAQWQNDLGFKKFLSHFYNQSSYLIERKIKREKDNFDLNPFASNEDDLLGLNTSIRNSLFYNRGKQQHSVTYTFLTNSLQNLQSSDEIASKNGSHQLIYNHLYKKYWLFTLTAKEFDANTNSKNYASRNFEINGIQLSPKISYLFSTNASVDIFYEIQNKQNKLGVKETLKQSRLGTSFNFASEKKLTLNGEFSWFDNRFEGDEFSPVAFQMLEGLQPGKNMVWRFLAQKNLTDFLDVNINYQGRKSETSKTVHTGNIQLRAYF